MSNKLRPNKGMLETWNIWDVFKIGFVARTCHCWVRSILISRAHFIATDTKLALLEEQNEENKQMLQFSPITSTHSPQSKSHPSQWHDQHDWCGHEFDVDVPWRFQLLPGSVPCHSNVSGQWPGLLDWLRDEGWESLKNMDWRWIQEATVHVLFPVGYWTFFHTLSKTMIGHGEFMSLMQHTCPVLVLPHRLQHPIFCNTPPLVIVTSLQANIPPNNLS